jgi:hypothetical protein
MAAHARGVDALGFPEFEEGIAHPVRADAGQIAGRRALPPRCNRYILRIAAEALQPGSPVPRGRLNSISGSPRLTMAGEMDMAPEVSHGAGPHSRTLIRHGGRHG